MNSKIIRIKNLILAAGLLGSSGCSSISQLLNPFAETPSEVAYLGDKNDNALRGDGGGKAETARAALESAATYQRAMAPQPQNPVINPAVVRLMWIPDHLNSHGDLVPAHYYYVRVLKDRWAVTDAFELQGQLGGDAGNASAMGFALPEDVQ